MVSSGHKQLNLIIKTYSFILYSLFIHSFSYEADYGYDDYREGGRDSGYSAPGQDYSGDHSHGYARQDSGYSHNPESGHETDRFLDQVNY